MKTLRNLTQVLCVVFSLHVSIYVRGQTYTILHTFGTNVMGQNPHSTLVQGADGTLYGTASAGGIANLGQVFKVNPDGTGYTALKDFIGSDGADPEAGLVLSGTTLYGTTVGGGTNDSGTVFKVNTDGSGFTVLKEFSESVDGVNPYGTLVLSGSTLFGTTEDGGDFGAGTVFKVDVDGTGFAVLKHFTWYDGGHPHGALALSGTTLYGTTVDGSSSGNGTIFKLNTDGSGFAVLRELDAWVDGGAPYAGLLLSDGVLYGMTSGGGSEGCGTLFKLKTDGTDFAVLKEFNYGEGYGLVNDLVLAGATLYGTSAHGGVSGGGTIFKIQTDGSAFSILRDFSDETDGRYPYAGFVLAGATLFATSSEGGAYGYGTLFKIESDGSGFAVLTNFPGGDGIGPRGGLLLSDQVLYGTTSGGGGADSGIIFSVGTNGGNYSVLKSFVRDEGAGISGRLVQLGGELYGTAAEGGNSDSGTLFKFETSLGTLTVLKHFGGMEGANPNAGLILVGTTLYGTTWSGGANWIGALFRINTDGSGFSVLKHFNGSDGDSPAGGPLLSAGQLFGATWIGGANGKGTVYRVSTNGSDFTTLRSFTGADGEHPSELYLADTTLYGVTAGGGHSGQGTVFRMETDGSGFVVLKQFTGDDGAAPLACLEPSGTTLFGTTLRGGINDNGVVFQIETDGTGYAVLKYFMGQDGALPWSPLTVVGGKLYGMTDQGGALDAGVLFSLSPGLPIIAIQPQDQTVGFGSTVWLETKATGWPSPDYQWYYNGTNILDNATNATLILTNALVQQAGDYTVVVSNLHGSATSAVARLEVLVEPPFIVSQPVDCTTNYGATVVFNITAGGTPPLAHQWLKDGDMVSDGGDISGAQTPMLTLANVVGGDAGGYSVIVSSPYGSVTSLVASLEVIIQPPFITSQPADCSTNFGAIVQFSVEADGTPPLAYQWHKDGLPLDESGDISGAQTSGLTLSNVFGGSAGGYSVVVSNGAGSVTSLVATLSVLDPFILQPPAFADWPLGQIGTLSVLVGGTPPFSYQWRKNGDNLSDATGDSIQIPVVRASSAGFYDVVVSNQYSSGVTSALAAVTVNLGVADSFDPGAGWVLCLALQPDGKILVGGFVMELAHHPQRFLGRLNPDGTFDSDFHPVLDERVMAMALQSDGKIVISGWFTSVNGQPRHRLARLNPDGSLDEDFTATVTGTVNAICIQPNHQILLGGEFTAINGEDHYNIARLNGDGSLDAGFNASSDKVNCLVLQPDGRILVGGLIAWVNGQERRLVARLQPDGSLDDTFQIAATPGQYGVVTALALQPDGRVILGGLFAFPTSPAYSSLVRVSTNGIFDPTFAAQLNNEPTCLMVQPDGKILVGGFFTSLDGCPISHFGRLNPDGSLDLSFNPAPDDYITSILFEPNGKLLVGGGFNRIGGQTRAGIARLDFYAPPQPIIQPSMQTAEIGFPTGFKIRDTGFPQPEYEWTHDGVVLDGATNRLLQLTSSGVGDIGNYQVIASNIVDIATSAPAFLNLIDPVQRRSVPGLILTGAPGGMLNLESRTVLDGGAVWSPLATVTLETPPDWWFDLTEPLPTQCFYRAMVISGGRVPPLLELNMIPALRLTGNVGDQIRVDGINRYGPTDAWFTLHTVTLTNTSQLYFDVSAPGQATRLYRIVPVP